MREGQLIRKAEEAELGKVGHLEPSEAAAQGPAANRGWKCPAHFRLLQQPLPPTPLLTWPPECSAYLASHSSPAPRRAMCTFRRSLPSGLKDDRKDTRPGAEQQKAWHVSYGPSSLS